MPFSRTKRAPTLTAENSCVSPYPNDSGSTFISTSPDVKSQVLGDGIDGGPHVGVGQHHALRLAGRTGRVEQAPGEIDRRLQVAGGGAAGTVEQACKSIDV